MSVEWMQNFEVCRELPAKFFLQLLTKNSAQLSRKQVPFRSLRRLTASNVDFCSAQSVLEQKSIKLVTKNGPTIS